MSLAIAFSIICSAAPWIEPDWAGKEPQFPPGSLYFHTNAYRACPTLYRTVVEVEAKPIDLAVLEGRAAGFGYVFVNGRLAGRSEKAEETAPLAVELAHLLEPGRNSIVVSAGANGLSMEGIVAYRDGTARRFGTAAGGWKATKLRPLTILEDEPCLRTDFDDSGWFVVREGASGAFTAADEALRAKARELSAARRARLDEEAAWRLRMLATKGIAIADGEAAGFGGAGRLPPWIREAATKEEAPGAPPGSRLLRAEALARLVIALDEAGNLERQAAGLEALGRPAADIEAVRSAARDVRAATKRAEEAVRAGRLEDAVATGREAAKASAALREGRSVNRPNRCFEDKFGWFDTTALLDSDPARWGLRLGPDVEVFSSPLSPASLVTAGGREIEIAGWSGIAPIKVYEKPPVVGPVCLWAVLDGKISTLRPGPDGVVYDRATHGKLSENWVALIHDLSRGGDLPIELVLLDAPSKVTFKAGEKGTEEVRIAFDAPGSRLLVLRPLKEWRGLLEVARILSGKDVDRRAERYVDAFRLWSRAALDYPVAFSEAFVREPDDPHAVRIADVYEYRTLKDAWGTQPLRLAPLPPLASYGLLAGYPGLDAGPAARAVGSLGIWGDLMAVEGSDRIVWRAPLDRIPRFGGFTSYCFGPTDIGEPGSLREIETVKATGSNSFRPQHNQTGDRALSTARWCVEQGIQNVFNIDEKWVPDAVEHYSTLAWKCRELPSWAIAYDLLNEPETRDPRAYNALVKKITRAIREADSTHIIYIEAMPPWGPGAKPFPKGAFENLEPTGDPLTVYSFHDYEFRLPPRWPNEKADVRDLLERWIPAFRFSIDHRAPIHLGEWGGFEQTKESVWDNPCALTMTLDFLDVFDAFGWHFHYYANRGTTRVRKDGSLEESKVQEAYRRRLARRSFNAGRGWSSLSPK
jgi:hypothetical protein